MQVAQIDEAPSTIGISDSDMYWAGSLEEINERLDLMQSLGVTNIRILVPWANMQPLHPDTPFGLGGIRWEQLDLVVNAAASRGIGILGVLNSTPVWASANMPINGTPTDFNRFADFAKKVALRYGDKISAYEVWNEPNSVQFWNSLNPTAYTEMLKVTYTALKQAAAQLGTEITVVGGVVGAGMSINGLTMNPVDFVRKMLEAGASGYFDALSFHSYNMTWKFSQTQGNAWQDAPLTQLNKIRALLDAALQPGQEQIKIWMTEYGMPTNVMTEAKQAEFIKDMIETWQTIAGAGPVFLYTIKDWLNGEANNNEAHFGIFRPDGTMKPVGQIIKELVELLTNPGENPGPGPGQGPGAGAGTSNPVAAFMKAIQKAVSGVFNVFPNLATAFSSALNNLFGGLFGKKKTATTTALSARTAAAGALPDEAAESVTDGSAEAIKDVGTELETVTDAKDSVADVKSVQQVQDSAVEVVTEEQVVEELPVVEEVPAEEAPVEVPVEDVTEEIADEVPADEVTESEDVVSEPATQPEADVTETVTEGSEDAGTVVEKSVTDKHDLAAADSTETASPEVRETSRPSLKARQELNSRTPRGLRKAVRADSESNQESRSPARQSAGVGSGSGSDD
ncbi:cellulase family glycosylhydrolase [Mycobacterium sp. AMU20-3851]|uniref:cellulase family glycosylhydrolase n=1 Tax=Mycobacterium sp. AMU20-3851 TaxID=3122055 RepID=UPI003754ACC2